MTLATRLSLIAALAGALCGASAVPSLSGPSGPGMLPTAEVVPHHYVQGMQSTTGTYVNYGAARNVEVGIGGNLRRPNADERDAGLFHAKYQMQGLRGGDTALGFRYYNGPTGEGGLERTLQFGVAYTQNVGRVGNSNLSNAHLTLGVNWAQRAAAGVTTDGLRPFAVLDATLGDDPTRNITATLDYQFAQEGLDRHALWALSGRIPFEQTGGFRAGFTNAAPSGITGSNTVTAFAALDLGWE